MMRNGGWRREWKIVSDPIYQCWFADDQSNQIDGGAGNDIIAAGTRAHYVHGGADIDFIYGMDKADILFGDIYFSFATTQLKAS